MHYPNMNSFPHYVLTATNQKYEMQEAHQCPPCSLEWSGQRGGLPVVQPFDRRHVAGVHRAVAQSPPQ
eukprot:6106913-Pyramimonas_sp.AAC.1